MKLNAWQPPMGMTTSLGNWLNSNLYQLKEKTEFPLIEISAIASFILGKNREWIFAHPDTILSPPQLDQLNESIQKLENGVPLSYITGISHFFGLEFRVNPQVLIPRPETEELVEKAIQWLEHHPGKRMAADIGTGSGAIAISLADRFPDLKILAVDISESALEIARQNARLNNVEGQIKFSRSDLLENVDQMVDLILANLPYIPTQDLPSLAVARFEPLLALDGGADGLHLISKLLSQARKKLAPGGCIILEFQYNHTNAVVDIIRSYYPDAQVNCYDDLSGIPRGVIIQY